MAVTTHQPDEHVVHARCTFCHGKGAGPEFERVKAVTGAMYRIPKSHAICKRTVLSLSLSLDSVSAETPSKGD